MARMNHGSKAGMTTRKKRLKLLVSAFAGVYLDAESVAQAGEQLESGLEAMKRGELDRIGISFGADSVAIVRDESLSGTVQDVPVFTLAEFLALWTDPAALFAEVFARAYVLKRQAVDSASAN